MKELNLLPNWTKLENLFLVYPSMRESLKEEFFELLVQILYHCHTKIVLLISPSEVEKFQTELKIKLSNSDYISDLAIFESLISEKIEFYKVEANDIWCKDYLSFNAVDKEGNLVLLKAIYDPSYGFNTQTDNSVGINIARNFNRKGIKTKLFPIKWDGGNLSTNGKYAIVTNKIFSENWEKRKDEIEKLFEETFETKFIFIPTESLDTIGHSDSIAVFLDEKTILLPIYEEDYKIDNRYISSVYKILAENLPSDYNFIFLPCSLSDVISEDNVFSAAGCFLNFLRIENHLFIPSFEECKKEQSEINSILTKYNPDLHLHFIKCDNISYYGGCFACISNFCANVSL